MKYTLYYYYKNQSRLFSEPRTFSTNNIKSLLEAIRKVEKSEYEIVDIVTADNN